jgi:hypothetical protein
MIEERMAEERAMEETRVEKPRLMNKSRMNKAGVSKARMSRNARLTEAGPPARTEEEQKLEYDIEQGQQGKSICGSPDNQIEAKRCLCGFGVGSQREYCGTGRVEELRPAAARQPEIGGATSQPGSRGRAGGQPRRGVITL